MTGTPRARLFWTVVVLGFAAWAVATRPVVLGLDLRGGATLRYLLEMPDTGATTPRDEMIGTTIDTLRRRIDTFGIKESSITRQGDSEIVIELPGSTFEDAAAIESIVSRVGRLEMRVIATDDLANSMSVETQRERLRALLEANPGETPSEIDLKSLELSFPDLIYRWYPYADDILLANRGLPEDADLEEALAAQPLTTADFELLRIDTVRSRTFTGGDIVDAGVGQDGRLNPAVRIDMDPGRVAEFEQFTGDHVGEPMVILLDGRIAEKPATIQSPLGRTFVIQSGGAFGFSEQELTEYLTIIRSGSLQMKPHLQYRNVIGPTLGESSIESGKIAAIVGLIAVLGFMVVYYRLAGVFAAVALVVNLLILLGVMTFLGATLTLPGIAGFVLTLGMAVDANILVFERIREEQHKGKDLAESVKEGFAKAFSTIVDANATTFVTAFILYQFGTGPVRGFAVVLMFGILSSLFSVLIVSRLMFDRLLASEASGPLSMARLLPADMHVRFMSRARTAFRVSAVLVVAALVAFFASGRDKYGLDFLGGYKAQVRLTEAATQAQVLDRVGEVFPGAQVVSVLGDDPLAEGSDRYVIKIKADPDDPIETQADLDALYAEPLKASLEGLIQDDGVTGLSLAAAPSQDQTGLSAVLHFTEPVADGQIERIREELGFVSEATVARAAPDAVRVEGTLAGLGHAPADATQRLVAALRDVEDLPPINEPLAESTTIGSRVGTELRDAAIQAIVLSLGAIILYIRVRFREYRYGLAAVIAVFHDVSITLGAIVLVRWLGLVDVEIDLAMIAAFLTIIGYSLNDTIVLFDRVRENLPRSNRPLPEVLDVSVNQTLSRTLLTSLTTLVVLVIIFALNYGQDNVLEGFAFAMIIGVLVGTYSSIFIASPALLMLGEKAAARDRQRQGKPKAKEAAA